MYIYGFNLLLTYEKLEELKENCQRIIQNNLEEIEKINIIIIVIIILNFTFKTFNLSI